MSRGACCFDNGTCTIESSDSCEEAGGHFRGERSTCAETCVAGACCFTDESCSVLIEDACGLAGGFYLGDETFCEGTCIFPTDECADAPVVGDGMYPYSIRSATDGPPFELPEACDEGHGVEFLRDVWIMYMASCNGVARASTCDSTFDNRMAVYLPGDACPGEFVACSDDACGNGMRRAAVEFPVVRGQAYLIRIGTPDLIWIGTGVLVIECRSGD